MSPQNFLAHVGVARRLRQPERVGYGYGPADTRPILAQMLEALAVIERTATARPVVRITPENRAWLSLVFGVEAVDAVARGEL